MKNEYYVGKPTLFTLRIYLDQQCLSQQIIMQVTLITYTSAHVCKEIIENYSQSNNNNLKKTVPNYIESIYKLTFVAAPCIFREISSGNEASMTVGFGFARFFICQDIRFRSPHQDIAVVCTAVQCLKIFSVNTAGDGVVVALKNPSFHSRV